jgi:hypothetical protein
MQFASLKTTTLLVDPPKKGQVASSKFQIDVRNGKCIFIEPSLPPTYFSQHRKTQPAKPQESLTKMPRA